MFYVAGFFSLHNIWHQYRLAELRRTVLSCTAAMSKLTNSTHSAAIEARRFIPTSPPFHSLAEELWDSRGATTCVLQAFFFFCLA